MYRAISFVGALMFGIALSSNALAGTQVLTFDDPHQNYGTSTWGTYNTVTRFEKSGGNPEACLLLWGIKGIGASFSNAGFTGDFAAGGYRRIAFDIKVKQWYPYGTQPEAVAYVFVRGGLAHDPWCRQIQGFAPERTQWKQYSVDFNPDWTNAQAQEHGWSIIDFPGASETALFNETIHNVFQTGMWIQVNGPPGECHILIDNYSLLPGSGGGALTGAPTKTIPKARFKKLSPEEIKMKQ